MSKANTQDGLGLNSSLLHSEVVSTTDSGEGLTQDANAESMLESMFIYMYIQCTCALLVVVSSVYPRSKIFAVILSVKQAMRIKYVYTYPHSQALPANEGESFVLYVSSHA